MSILNKHPDESSQGNSQGIDETEYLLASAAMKEHLDKAAEQEKNGEGAKITLDDISQ